jgi:endonuclease/exonuclease/phosphatase family metal-dependent hydrolase
MINEKYISIFDKIILGLNICVSGLLLLSYFAPIANPRYFSPIAVIGFAFPILVPINIIFIPYWLLRGIKVYSLISVSCLVAGLTFIIDYWGLHFAKTESIKPANAIRVMQYNIRAFGIFEYTSDSTEKKLYSLLRDKKPDILAFEEFFVRNFENGVVTDSIKKALKSNYHYFKPFQITEKDSAGNAIFSKYPIVNSGAIASNDKPANEAMFIDIKKGKQIIRVYCIHLMPVKMKDEEKLKYLEGKISFSRAFFIKRKLTQAFIQRSLQVAQIEDHINKCPYPFILTGDFNDTPISYSVNTLGSGLKNAFREKGTGFLKTYYSNYPLQIDFIFTSRQFNILNYQALDNKLSDHKPIISDVVLN